MQVPGYAAYGSFNGHPGSGWPPAGPEHSSAQAFLAAVRNAAKRNNLSQALFLLRQAQAAHEQEQVQHAQHAGAWQQPWQQQPLPQQQPYQHMAGSPQFHVPYMPPPPPPQPQHMQQHLHLQQQQQQHYMQHHPGFQQQQQQQNMQHPQGHYPHPPPPQPPPPQPPGVTRPPQGQWRGQLVHMYSALLSLASGRWCWELWVRGNHLLRQPGADVGAIAAGVAAGEAAMQDAAQACWATGQRDATARGADGCSGQVPDGLLCQVSKNVDAPEVPEDPPWVTALLAHHQPVPYTPAAALQLGLDLYQEAAAAGLLPHEALVSGGARLLALSGAYEEALALAVAHAKSWQDNPAAAAYQQELALQQQQQQQQQKERRMQQLQQRQQQQQQQQKQKQPSNPPAEHPTNPPQQQQQPSLLSAQRRALAPRLRDFQPALVGLALQGEVGRVLEVAALLAQLELPGCAFTDSEYGLLLEALANAPTTTSATYAEISTALECLTDQGGALHPNTLAVVRRCFEGPAAAASSVFGPGGQLHKCGARWACQWVEPDQEGLLPGIVSCGLHLEQVGMEPGEWEGFAAAVRTAATRGHPLEAAFDKYVKWLDKHEPFQVVLDVSNLAFHGADERGGAMDFSQVLAVAEAVAAARPGAHMLAVINSTRYKKVVEDKAHPAYAAWLAERHTARALFIIPKHIDDDWYWLYGGVRMREHGLVVTNDRMQDHSRTLLTPEHFLQWRERHVATFSFQEGPHGPQPVITWPRPYTTCVQRLPGEVWALPVQTQDVLGTIQQQQEQQQGPRPPEFGNVQVTEAQQQQQQQQQQQDRPAQVKQEGEPNQAEQQLQTQANGGQSNMAGEPGAAQQLPLDQNDQGQVEVAEGPQEHEQQEQHQEQHQEQQQGAAGGPELLDQHVKQETSGQGSDGEEEEGQWHADAEEQQEEAEEEARQVVAPAVAVESAGHEHNHAQQQQQQVAWMCIWPILEDGTPAPSVRAAAAAQVQRRAAQQQLAAGQAAAAAVLRQQRLNLPPQQAEVVRKHKEQQHQQQQKHQQHAKQHTQAQHQHGSAAGGASSGGKKRKQGGGGAGGGRGGGGKRGRRRGGTGA